MGDPAMRPNHALDALTPALPWVWFLPAKDQAAFVRELVDINSPMPVAELHRLQLPGGGSAESG
ncbi:hypothetical protein [Kribbella sp. NPDC048915]|uniref:hypothetical protein n=1 Tax=Kribbella sp. NPDC048915 TaxID=3155148 RepID=UPI0033C4054D